MNGGIGWDALTLTEILGDACPDCGWRRNAHRPPTTVGGYVKAACVRYAPAGGAA